MACAKQGNKGGLSTTTKSWRPNLVGLVIWKNGFQTDSQSAMLSCTWCIQLQTYATNGSTINSFERFTWRKPPIPNTPATRAWLIDFLNPYLSGRILKRVWPHRPSQEGEAKVHVIHCEKHCHMSSKIIHFFLIVTDMMDNGHFGSSRNPPKTVALLRDHPCGRQSRSRSTFLMRSSQSSR